MAKTDSAKTLWQVQVRRSRNHKWRSKGIYEVREDARYMARLFREGRRYCEPDFVGITVVGFGNTRVVKHIRGEKK